MNSDKGGSWSWRVRSKRAALLMTIVAAFALPARSQGEAAPPDLPTKRPASDDAASAAPTGAAGKANRAAQPDKHQEKGEAAISQEGADDERRPSGAQADGVAGKMIGTLFDAAADKTTGAGNDGGIAPAPLASADSPPTPASRPADPEAAAPSDPFDPFDPFDPPRPVAPPEGFRWGPALRQSLLFLAVQHGYRMTEPKTQRELRGPFFKDYFRSLKNLKGWDDGGRFFTNYVAHPMQGAVTGFVFVQNDPRSISREFGSSREYWTGRLKAMAWSAAWSTQFEIGPVSQASLGDVGKKSGKLTYVDLVITPTVGVGWLVAEDALDRFVVRRIETKTDNLFVRITARTVLNPTRTAANLLRFKKPWHRDTRNAGQ